MSKILIDEATVKLALEALLNWKSAYPDEFDLFDEQAITALKALAEQPAQRTWVGLTDEEIEMACVPLGAAMLSFTEVARAIEAKLKDKNT